MAVKVYQTPESGRWDLARSQYICDTEAELPVVAVDGDYAYCKDTNTSWVFGDAAWDAVGSGGASWGSVTGTLANQLDLQAALDAKEAANANIQAHIGSISNPHSVTKAQVGLGNAENTSDAAKPISTATQTALDTKAAASHTHAIADTTNLQTTLDGKAASSHSHAISDVTNLQTTLDGKSATGHTHAQLHDRSHSITSVDDHTFPGGTSTFLRADGAFASPPGGSEAFPIGAVFIAVVSTNPGTLLGYGTWSAFGAGRVLVGLDSGDTDFDVAEETGGAKTVASSVQTFAGTPFTDVINHTHPVTDPGHTHLLQRYPTTTGGSSGFTADTSMSGTPTDTTLSTKTNTTGITTSNPAGGVASITPAGTNTPGAATSVVQPYIVCYFWKRTA